MGDSLSGSSIYVYLLSLTFWRCGAPLLVDGLAVWPTTVMLARAMFMIAAMAMAMTMTMTEIWGLDESTLLPTGANQTMAGRTLTAHRLIVITRLWDEGVLALTEGKLVNRVPGEAYMSKCELNCNAFA